MIIKKQGKVVTMGLSRTIVISSNERRLIITIKHKRSETKSPKGFQKGLDVGKNGGDFQGTFGPDSKHMHYHHPIP